MLVVPGVASSGRLLQERPKVSEEGDQVEQMSISLWFGSARIISVS